MRDALKIDHITIAGQQLDAMREAFADIGLKTFYGGPHSNGITHMALSSFDDGSYIELISSLNFERQSPWWHEHIVDDGGPCAWAVQVEDVAGEAARVAALGVAVAGPSYYTRERPDGVLVEWDLAFLGNEQPGAVLPFIIKDRTPRNYRVPYLSLSTDENKRVESGSLTGVAMVVIGVKNLEAAIELFQKVYNWPAPEVKQDTHFESRLAYFTGAPVTLASPLEPHNWLSKRLSRFGDSPCAFLLGTDRLDEASSRFNLIELNHWFDRPLAWFDPNKLNGTRLGVIEVNRDSDI